MKSAAASKGLGKGLQALMSESYSRGEENTGMDQANGLREIALHQLVAGKYQPRRHFAQEELNELADSIRTHGIMQPLVVRQAGTQFEIIAGERRWRAAQIVQLATVPVIVRELSDTQALELGIIENVQRKDLNPLEEGAGYRRLIEEFGHTQDQLAKIVGKSRSHIANLLRLETLPERIKTYIDSGDLTMGHARAILSAKDPQALAERIMAVGMSVRQAEELARQEHGGTQKVSVKKNGKSSAASPSVSGTEKSEDVAQLEQMLSDSLGLKVSITTQNARAGEVVITYESLNELDQILQRLSEAA